MSWGRAATLPLVGLVCAIAPAKADPNVARCDSSPSVAQEYIANGAVRRFDVVDQQQFGLGYFRSACNGEGAGRWVTTAALSFVEEEGFNAQSILGQGGYQFVLSQSERNSWHLTPMVIAGYEHFDGDRQNVVLGVSSALQWTYTLNEVPGEAGASARPGVILSLLARPEYQWRTPVGPISADDTDSSSAFVSASLDVPLSTNRVKIGIADREYLSGPTSVDSIQSLSVGFRPVCGPNDEYPWSVDLLVEQGNNEYSAATISFSIRNASGPVQTKCSS